MAYKYGKDNKWVGSVLIETLGEEKKKRSRKFGFKTKREAEKWENEQKTINSILEINPSMKTVFIEFLASKNGAVSKSTYIKNQTMIKLHLEPYLSTKKLSEVNYHLVMKWRSELLEKGLSAQRINQLVKFLKEIYNFAAPIYKIDNHPFTQIKKLKEEEKEEMKFYTLDEYEKFIAVVDDQIYIALFSVLYFCGLRKGELLALTFKDVDYKNETITINKSLNQKIKGQEYFIGPPKNKSSNRTIKVDAKTLSKIQMLENEYKKKRGFNKNRYVFGNSKPISETTLSNYYLKYQKLSGVKRIRIHDFRHSHASLLINNGANAVLVAKRLGHSDIKMTLNTYSHLFENEENKMVEIIDKLQSVAI